MIEQIFGPTAPGKSPHYDHLPEWRKGPATLKRWRSTFAAFLMGVGLALPIALSDGWIELIAFPFFLAVMAYGFVRLFRLTKLEERRWATWVRDHDCPIDGPLVRGSR